MLDVPGLLLLMVLILQLEFEKRDDDKIENEY